MKTKISFLAAAIVCFAFAVVNKGYSQCRMGIATTWIEGAYRYVKVTSECDVDKTIAIQIKRTDGNYLTVAYTTVGPKGWTQGYCTNPTSTYRWALLDKNESTDDATKNGLWHNE